jgi:hypothetical protein
MNTLRWRNIVVVPSFHARMQFAKETRRIFFAQRPDAIAVELPESIREAVLDGVRRLPYLSVVIYQEQDGKHCYVPIDPCDSIIEATRLAVEHELPLAFVDLDVEGYLQRPRRLPDPYAIEKAGLEDFYQRVVADLPSEPIDLDRNREREMAARLFALSQRHERVMFVCGMAHWERIRALLEGGNLPAPTDTEREGVVLANLSPKSFGEVLGEIPYLTYLYEITRQKGDAFDLLDGVTTLMLDSAEKYTKEWGERMSRAQRQQFLQYARNSALIDEQLTPSLFNLVVSGKGIVDDEYAGELLDLALSYPFMEKDSKLPTVEIHRNRGKLGSRYVTVRRRVPLGERQTVKVPLKRRARKEQRDKWRDQSPPDRWQCKHVPEDIYLWEFSDHVRDLAMGMLIDQQTRTVEFTTSLLDGLDFRETTRNWALGEKLYVQESYPVRGEVGPVVVIFDEDNEHRTYTHTWTGFAEAHDDGDFGVYCTQPGEQVVGPGIFRTEIGGFAALTPPKRFWDREDIWWSYDGEAKADVLLRAAIDYAEEKFIAYCAVKPPSPRLCALAEQRGKRVIHLSLALLSPDRVKRMREMHMLATYDHRSFAHEYIAAPPKIHSQTRERKKRI